MSKLILPIERPFNYRIAVPGSKSVALRQLLISALADSESELSGIPPCDDVDAMVDCLRTLGTTIEGSYEHGLLIKPQLNLNESLELNAQQSGVTLRLLLAVAALRSGTTSFVGSRSLAQRPNQPLLDSLRLLGCKVTANEGKLPITIQGPAQTSDTRLDAALSSQFLSALLVVAPVLPNGLEIQLTSDLASASYAEGTIRELVKRGIRVDHNKTGNVFQIAPQRYAGKRLQIEGDASAATYHMALATLHNGNVQLENVGEQSWQPDYEFFNVCKRLGAEVSTESSSTTIRGPTQMNSLQSIDMAAMPDAAPTLMALGPHLPEPVHISGLSTLRHKECDRISCPATELKKAGVKVQESEDALTIWPGEVRATTFDTYDDHRMAMSFAVLSTKANGCRINDPKCVNKTYVNFWRDLSLAYA